MALPIKKFSRYGRLQFGAKNNAATLRTISGAERDWNLSPRFTQRIPGIDVSTDKAKVLKRLEAAHREIRNAIGFGDWPLFTAQQVHGNKIAILERAVASAILSGLGGRKFPGCDGIITNQRGVALG